MTIGAVWTIASEPASDASMRGDAALEFVAGSTASAITTSTACCSWPASSGTATVRLGPPLRSARYGVR